MQAIFVENDELNISLYLNINDLQPFNNLTITFTIISIKNLLFI
jgi:hypothetical protein